jgi:hypothetical protein
VSTMNCPRAVSLRPFLACYSLPRHEREGPRSGIARMAGGARERERRAISSANHRRSSGRGSARPVAGPRAAKPGATGPGGTRRSGTSHRGPTRGRTEHQRTEHQPTEHQRTEHQRTHGPGGQTTQRLVVAGTGVTPHGPVRCQAPRWLVQCRMAQRTAPHRPVQCRTTRCRTTRCRTTRCRTTQTPKTQIPTTQTPATQCGATHPAVRRRSEPGLGDHQLPGGRHGVLRERRLADFLVDRPFRGACARRAACRAWSRAHDDYPPLWQVLICPCGRTAVAHTARCLAGPALGAIHRSPRRAGAPGAAHGRPRGAGPRATPGPGTRQRMTLKASR